MSLQRGGVGPLRGEELVDEQDAASRLAFYGLANGSVIVSLASATFLTARAAAAR